MLNIKVPVVPPIVKSVPAPEVIPAVLKVMVLSLGKVRPLLNVTAPPLKFMLKPSELKSIAPEEPIVTAPLPVLAPMVTVPVLDNSPSSVASRLKLPLASLRPIVRVRVDGWSMILPVLVTVSPKAIESAVKVISPKPEAIVLPALLVRAPAPVDIDIGLFVELIAPVKINGVLPFVSANPPGTVIAPRLLMTLVWLFRSNAPASKVAANVPAVIIPV
ncbi:MAG: hypothetical protein KJ722_07210 [Candidatus Omnitrophica bacterium]|nr:hypothetical protein [Candidatus Omnitrophota bacterium]